MFVLATLKHTVKIQPRQFAHDFKATLVDEINSQFANYVIPDVGLCVTFNDFKTIGSSFILPGEADTYTPVVFRYVAFQPFVDEIMEGTISKSSGDGLTISLLFFQDILVEPDCLPTVSKFEDVEQVWYWEYTSDDGETTTRFYMEPGRRVRFRILSVDYRRTKPEDEHSALSIKATMKDCGLGCTSWWDTNTADDAKQEERDGNEEVDVV